MSRPPGEIVTIYGRLSLAPDQSGAEGGRNRERRGVGVEQRRYLDDAMPCTLVGAVPT